VVQAELDTGSGVAAGPGRDLEHAQSIERRQTTHGTREKNRQVM
jgi:hypothetical protein